MEILDGQGSADYFEFRRTLNTLALRVAGAGALPYGNRMKRRERLAFYAQARPPQAVCLLRLEPEGCVWG